MAVEVLLSSYNGEKYIAEQIDSILQQEKTDVRLTVRDDGSKDRTMDILDRYAQLPNVTVYRGNNLGAANAFMEMLCRSGEAEYYAFADQDDIWLKGKLRRAVEFLEKESGPCLYASNQTIADAEGHALGKRYRSVPPADLANTMVCNRLAGCTMVFNRKLRDLLIRPESRPSCAFLSLRMHDAWVVMAADCLGKVVYDHRSFILYRQHESNVVGANIGSGLQFFKKNGRSALHVPRQAARELLRAFPEGIHPREREVLDSFLQLDTPLGKIRFCRNKELIRQLETGARYARVKALTGIW